MEGMGGGLDGKRPGTKLRIWPVLIIGTGDGISLEKYWGTSDDKMPGGDIGRWLCNRLG